MTRRRKIIWSLGSIASVLLLLALLLSLGGNLFKPAIEGIVSAKTGRAFNIHGDLKFRLCCPFSVYAENLEFENPDWAENPKMLQVAKAEFSISLWRLVKNELYLPVVWVRSPQVHLEVNEEDQRNWILSRDGKTGIRPAIGRLQIDDGEINFRDTKHQLQFNVKAQTTQPDQPDFIRTAKQDAKANKASKAGITASGTGLVKGIAFQFKARGGSVLSLQDTTLPYPLRVDFNVGSLQGQAEGTVTGLSALASADIHVDIRTDSTEELFPLLGIALPPLPPTQLQGRLIRETPYWRLQGFAGRMGDSDISGDINLRYENDRAHLDADIQSQQIDLDDLAGLIGAPPETGAGETASRKQKQQAAKLAASDKLLPDDPYKLNRMRAMDADISFRGKSIRGYTVPIDELRVDANLESGVLKVRQLDVGLAGGKLAGNLQLDATEPTLKLSTDLEAKRLHLGKLIPESEMIRASEGLIGGRAQLTGTGDSFASILAQANGSVGLAMSGGEISNLLLELTGLDGAEVLRYLFRENETAHLRCAVAEVEIKQGVAVARNIVVDTSDTNLSVTGQANFSDESLDFTLQPLPKDWSPLALRSPLHIKGTFKNPSIQPDEELILKGGIAAVLASIAAPVAALIPLIETGPGENTDCKALISTVAQRTDAELPQDTDTAKSEEEEEKQEKTPDSEPKPITDMDHRGPRN